MNTFPNLEAVHCSMSSSNCCFLTCIQILQEVGKVVWYSHLLNNFPQVKQQGALPTENYAEDAEHGPAYQNKTQFTPQSVSPIRGFHKPLILLHQRTDRLKTTITEN